MHQGTLISVAVLSSLALTAPSASGSTVSGSARLVLAKAAPVAPAAVRPATRSDQTLRFRTTSLTVIDGVGEVRLSGGLRFRSGRRVVTFDALRLVVRRAGATVTGRRGGRRSTVLRLVPAEGRSPRVAADRVALDRASAHLTVKTARTLRSGLRLRRMPSTRASLGSLSVVASRAAGPAAPLAQAVSPIAPGPPAAAAAPTAPAPAPVPAAASAPTPTPTPTPTPGPTSDPDACWSSRPATPANATDWIACSLPGGSSFGLGSLRSWINYLRAFGGDALAADGATRVESAVPYDHRLPASAPVIGPDGTVTLPHAGRIAYVMAAHGIDSYVEDLVLVVAPDRETATVTATARFTPRDAPGEPPTVAPRRIVHVDLAAATSRTTTATTDTFVHAPAALTDEGRDVFGEDYAVGAPWGALTFTLPAP